MRLSTDGNLGDSDLRGNGGADNWVEVETFGKSKEEWLREFLELKYGIPSHDTFGDVFGMMDAEEFQRSFMRWVEGCSVSPAGK